MVSSLDYDSIYVSLIVNNKTYLLTADPSILKSSLCCKNSEIITSDQVSDYHHIDEIVGNKILVVNVYNDPLYISKYLSNITLENIAIFVDYMVTNDIKEFTSSSYTLISKYIKSIDPSLDMWFMLSNVKDHNAITLSTRYWFGDNKIIRTFDRKELDKLTKKVTTLDN